MEITITPMLPDHWLEVAHIYGLGIATGIATFEQSIPTWEQWDKVHMKTCRLVALEGDTVVGWAALSPVSGRCVYGGVAEVSVYVHTAHGGKGIGTRLMQALIIQSEAEGFWTLQSGIFQENKASRELHKKVGFREIGFRERIGKKEGQWFNNILMERRSNTVGI
jgi:L-amino acid N-acyltransferase YncA